jgi:thiosulfate/3-mercaptopyruvate sulfurtransferase
MWSTLISAGELATHVDEPDWVILDCRFDLTRPEWGAQAFATAHLPHAHYLHLDRDLSGPRSSSSGRHPLPQPPVLAATFGRLGIDTGVQVIAYDQGAAGFAARLWWLLRWLGHRAVAVLDGGFGAWQRAGLPLESAAPAPRARRFTGVADGALLVSGAEVAAALASGALERQERVLVDARAADRFAGQNESIDPVAGHIPGARNHPFAGNHDREGRFLAPAELRRAWQRTLNGRDPAHLIAMCGSGVTACDNLLALEVAGLSGARLYAGSWSEWIRDPAHAIARGPETAG